MQRLKDMSTVAQAELTEDMVDDLIELEAAHRGVPLAPPCPESPKDKEPKPTVPVYTVAGVNLLKRTDADKLLDVITKLDSTVGLSYTNGPGFKQYISDFYPPSVSTTMVYAADEYERYKGLLANLGSQKDTYDREMKAYKEAKALWDEVVEDVVTTIATSRALEQKRLHLQGRYDRFLELADGDAETAMRFYTDSYPNDKWALEDDALPFTPVAE